MNKVHSIYAIKKFLNTSVSKVEHYHHFRIRITYYIRLRLDPKDPIFLKVGFQNLTQNPTLIPLTIQKWELKSFCIPTLRVIKISFKTRKRTLKIGPIFCKNVFKISIKFLCWITFFISNSSLNQKDILSMFKGRFINTL